MPSRAPTATAPAATTAPPRQTRPAPTARQTTTPATATVPARVEFETPSGHQGERILLYGPGGVGKSTLASLIDGAVFIDLDGTVHALNQMRASLSLPPVRRARPQDISNWNTLRQALHNLSLWDGVRAIVIDSTKPLQEWALAHTLNTVPHEKGNKVNEIEGYGYGKGWQHVYDTFVPLLGDLDMHVQAGRHVVIISHAVTDTAPNPFGEDYQRYEPDLNKPPKVGRIRDRIIAWADHVLFVTFDVFVNEKGKGQGGETRTIYTIPMASHIAKTRTLRDVIAYDEGDDRLWELMGINPVKDQ